MTARVGIDIGGTFTDFALLTEDGTRLVIHKQLTTPSDPSRSVLDGLSLLLDKASAGIDKITTIVHGTTLVANAVIERTGAVTGMLTTAGFRDILEMGLE